MVMKGHFSGSLSYAFANIFFFLPADNLAGAQSAMLSVLLEIFFENGILILKLYLAGSFANAKFS